MASKSAKECAVAVNQLISLDCEDQGALLEVLDSYFCHPNRDLDSDDSSTEDELEDDPTATEVLSYNIMSYQKNVRRTKYGCRILSGQNMAATICHISLKKRSHDLDKFCALKSFIWD